MCKATKGEISVSEGKNLSLAKPGLLSSSLSIASLLSSGFLLARCRLPKYEKVVFLLMVMTNICSYICVKCILYDLLLNWIYMAASMDIRTSDKTAMVFLKGRKNNKTVLKSSHKFSQKYKGSFFVFSFKLVNPCNLTKRMVHLLSFLKL